MMVMDFCEEDDDKYPPNISVWNTRVHNLLKNWGFRLNLTDFTNIARFKKYVDQTRGKNNLGTKRALDI